jgi:hypothetical protein
MLEFFHLLGILADCTLVPKHEKSFVWRWLADCVFSAKSVTSHSLLGLVGVGRFGDLMLKGTL